jgi:hypothetical protein
MMKRISFNKFLLISLIFAGICSCKDMMDFHQKYIKNGEIIYLSKMDSVITYPGKNRVQISGYLTNAYNVNKIMVYWNSRADSMAFDYVQKKSMDSLNLIIPNLAEKSYLFDIYTVNSVGNRSIKVSIAGTAYGDFYRKNLVPRTNNGFDFDGTNVRALWLAADGLERGTNIRYTTETTGIASIFLSNDSAQIALPNRKSDTPFTFQSVYVPEKTAIDTFRTSWITIPVFYEIKVSKTGWKITGFDSQEPKEGAPNGFATAAIDDNLNTYWHTQWSGGTPGYPHWFSIDMGKDVPISSIEVFRRQGNGNGQTRHQFLYSSNGTDWTDFGTFPMDPTTNNGQKFRSTINPTARYIKYIALQGPKTYAFLAELNVYSPFK